MIDPQEARARARVEGEEVLAAAVLKVRVAPVLIFGCAQATVRS